jgi:hypothetical protein
MAMIISRKSAVLARNRKTAKNLVVESRIRFENSGARLENIQGLIIIAMCCGSKDDAVLCAITIVPDGGLMRTLQARSLNLRHESSLRDSAPSARDAVTIWLKSPGSGPVEKSALHLSFRSSVMND